MYTHTEAMEAMRARINGEWDNEQLMKLGPLSTDPHEDIAAILAETEEVADGAPQKLHVLSVTRAQERVRIYSDYWDDFVIVPYDNEPGALVNPEIDTAIKYLLSRGFEILGPSTGKAQHYIVAKNFLKLK